MSNWNDNDVSDLVPAPYEEDDDSEDTAPYVCPGCYSVGAEPCSPDCSDASLERERFERQEHADELSDSWDDLSPCEQNELVSELDVEFLGLSVGSNDDDDFELVPESHQVAPLQEAAAELALATRRLDETVHRLERSLSPSERAVLQRRFRPRRQMKDSDVVATDKQTGKVLTRAEWRRDWQRAMAGTFWSDRVQCASCQRWHPVYLESPPKAAERNVPSATTVQCACGTRISLAYSWSRQKVVGLRYHPPPSAQQGRSN